MSKQSFDGYLVVEQWGHPSTVAPDYHGVYLNEQDAEAEVENIKKLYPSSNVYIEIISVYPKEMNNGTD